MPETVNIHEAKTHLSRLLERVRRGDTITIARAGEPIALLVPIGRAPTARRVRERGVVPEVATADRRSWPLCCASPTRTGSSTAQPR
jgi:prevent-host-death family protein